MNLLGLEHPRGGAGNRVTALLTGAALVATMALPLTATAASTGAMTLEASATSRVVDSVAGVSEVRLCITNTNPRSSASASLVADDVFALSLTDGCGGFESLSRYCDQDLTVKSSSGSPAASDFLCEVAAGEVTLRYVGAAKTLEFGAQVCITVQHVGAEAGNCVVGYRQIPAMAAEAVDRLAPVASGFVSLSVPGTSREFALPLAVPRSAAAPTSCPLSVDPCLIGPPGPPGPAGPAGPQGPQGDVGPQGNVGPQGPIGLTGPQGPVGATGPQGPQGNVGPQGPIGLTGPQGPQGNVGPQGPIGLTGPQGNVGPQGPVGATGPQGPQGDVGPQGPIGLTGAPGATGPQGPQGDVGPQGPIGLTGAPGATGPQGPQGNVGPQGPIGLTGAPGATGPQGPIGLTGPQGPQGDVGPQGPIGLTGAPGATGPQGPIGLTGAPGATGPQGPIGLTGAPGATGPQGPIGLTGATGAAGPQGVPGATGATGATGAAGPQGVPGATGATGATGANGPQGPTGATGPVGATGATGPAGSANISGTTSFHIKFTGATTGGNSMMQDNGTGASIGTSGPSSLYLFNAQKTQLAANGDGQATLYGFRNRDVQNDGTSYGTSSVNSAVQGYNFWGDLYTFGVSGHNFNDFTRTGGVLGAEIFGSYWGSLGYRSSGSINYGVFGSSAYASGGGRLPEAETAGIGGGFYGDFMGGWVRGDVMGLMSSGEMFASYNLGDEYTSGRQIDLVTTADGGKAAAYSMTSTDSRVYSDGAGQLNGGTTRVEFDRPFAVLLAEGALPTITVSPTGTWASLYIVSVDKTGFTVGEANGGTSAATFNWIAVGKRIDAGSPVPSALLKQDFDRNAKGLMFNEGNKEQSGSPMWWDGSEVRFTTPPDRTPAKPAER